MAPSHPPTTCKPTTEEIENRIAQTLASGPLSLQGIADAMWPWSKGHEDAIADVFERIVQRLGEGHDALWRLHPTHASAIAGESGVEKTSVEDASVEKNDTEQRKGSKMLISRLPHVEERTEEDGDDRNHVSPRQSAPSSTSSPSPPPSSLKEVSQQLGQTRSRAPSPISTASLSPPPSNLTSSLSSVPSPSPAPDSPSSPQSPASTSGTTSTISELSSSLSSTRSTPPPFADLEVVAAEVGQEVQSTTTTERKAGVAFESGSRSTPSKKEKTAATVKATKATKKPAGDDDAAGTERNIGKKPAGRRAPKQDVEQVQCVGLTKKKKTRCGLKKMVPTGTVWDCGRHD